MKYILIILLFISYAFNCYAQEIVVKIIETTDVHGKLINYKNDEKYSNNSLANIYTYVSGLRAENKNVILLDNGDILQGDPSVYYYNFLNDSIPHLCSRVMNYMKYDAASVGNHDIETGHDVYDRVKKEYNFPWLAANAINEKTGEPYFEPFTIVERNNLRIAIFGLVTPKIPDWLPKEIWEGMYFEDMVKSAKKWMPIIQKEEPDLIVGLFHAGVDYTYGNQDSLTEKNENAVKLVAQQVNGFDVIFAGHDHKEWNFKVNAPNGEEVLILGGGSHSKMVAQANIVFQIEGKNKYVKSLEGEIVKMTNVKSDKGFDEEFANDEILINNFINKEIGRINQSILSNKSLFGDSEFMDLIHNAQLHVSKADISFAAPLSYNSTIGSGKINVADMFSLYRFENLLYTMELSGAEIDAYLEYSYNLWMDEMDNKDDHLLKFRLVDGKKSKLANAFYNFDSAEGIYYTIDLSKPVGDRVDISTFVNGEKFEFEKKYKVAINSYRGNGGGGHLIQGAGINKNDLTSRILVSTEKDLRFYMMQWIENSKEIKPSCNNNWSILPTEWYEKAYKQDFELLFGK
jgi:2',3'-cyclic-nucleotide 2'-phosphodiesterase / 3'-nucleotidase